MKVSNTPVQLDAYIKQSHQQQKQNQGSNKVVPGAPNTVDKVELSSQAKQIQQAAETVGKTSEINEEKVQQVKMDIENGTYKVNGAKVAGAMLNETFENDLILQKVSK